VRCAAKAMRLFKHCVEHRGEIARRRTDDLQYLGGGGLLLQCLVCLSDQPGILDRDDRLVGKSADQFDLPLAERLDPMAMQHENANWLALAQQRDAEHRPQPPEVDRLGMGMFRISCNVRNMNNALLEDRPPANPIATWHHWKLTRERFECGL